MDVFISILSPLLGVALVIALAYYGTRWLAKQYAGGSVSKYMRVLERMPLGTDKSMALVRVGSKILLLSVSAKDVDVLASLEESELVAQPAQPEKNEFSGVLSAVMKKQAQLTKYFRKNNDDDSGEDKP